MKIYIPLSAIYSIQYDKKEYSTLKEFQEYLFMNVIDCPYNQLEHAMNEYMQDERKEATAIIWEKLNKDKKYKHITIDHLNSAELKEYIDHEFIRSLGAAWRDSYIAEYTLKFKNDAFENLENLLDKEMKLNYSKLELFTRRSHNCDEEYTKINTLEDLQCDWKNTPPQVWEATDLAITINRANATEAINYFSSYHEVNSTHSNDEVADFLHDTIIDELSTISIDTEYYDRYGTLGDMDDWKEAFIHAYYADDAIEAIKTDLKREEKEELATVALYDAARCSSLIDIKEYAGTTITAEHNGNVFDINITFKQ